MIAPRSNDKIISPIEITAIKRYFHQGGISLGICSFNVLGFVVNRDDADIHIEVFKADCKCQLE